LGRLLTLFIDSEVIYGGVVISRFRDKFTPPLIKAALKTKAAETALKAAEHIAHERAQWEVQSKIREEAINVFPPRHQPYWPNISAKEIAKKFHVPEDSAEIKACEKLQARFKRSE
jgi:hypothetical protein